MLGQAPEGGELVNLVLAILRSPQIFGGQVNGVPGLRAALGMRAELVEAHGDALRQAQGTFRRAQVHIWTGSGHISTGSGHIWTGSGHIARD